MREGCIKTQGSMVDWLKKAVFIPVILLLVSVGGVGAVTPVTGCGTLSTAGETYVLSNDISTSGTCFIIGADNITLDGAGYSITGSGSSGTYGVYLNGRSGVTMKNLNINGFYTGIYLRYFGSNTLTNNNANSNSQYGIYLSYSSNNTITNNNAKENGYYDIDIRASSDAQCNNIIENNTGSGDRPIKYFNTSVSLQDEVLSELILCNADNSNINNVTIEGSATKKNNGLLVIKTDYSNFTNIDSSNNTYGIWLKSSSNNTITNNTANSNNDYGILLEYSSSNTLTGNTANSNDILGISLWSSSNYNTLTDNTAKENNDYDVYVWPDSDAGCNNHIENNTGSGDRPIKYFNSSINLQNELLSELILCNADNSNIKNVTIEGSATKKNNGLFVFRTDYSNFTNISSSNNNYGISLDSSSGNTIAGNTASNNGRYGILVKDYSKYNNITNNTANSNYYTGISLYSSSSNTLTGNTANSNNDYGIHLDHVSNNVLTGNIMSANTYNFYVGGSSIWDFVQTIDTTNTVDGKPIYYLVGVSGQVIDASTNAGFVGVVNSNNVTVRDLTLTKNWQGVLFVNISDSSVENVTASNNYNGIWLYRSRNNTLTNNTAWNNTLYGIYLRYSSSNNLTDNTASNNMYGIHLYSSSNYNTISNNNFSNNNRGIFLWTSSSNILTNNTASNNGGYGIWLFRRSNYNNLTSNNASNNQYGIYLYSSSNYNTLTNNTVSLNYYGIYFDYYYSGCSNGNLIYNNLFNNTNNVYFSFGDCTYTNSWNTTKTPGPNIIGGPYLGGNFWAKPDGTDFSEICADSDGDGICDLSYSLTSGNIDYLPLTIPPVDVTTTVIQRLDYRFNITWTIPQDPELKEFNIYQRLNDNSSTDTLIDTVPANYTQPYIAGPGFDDGNLYQYMVTAVNTSGSEGSGAYAPKGLPAPPIPFAPLGTLLTLGSGLAAYLWYRRKVI